jgi:hypothetical protein
MANAAIVSYQASFINQSYKAMGSAKKLLTTGCKKSQLRRQQQCGKK